MTKNRRGPLKFSNLIVLLYPFRSRPGGVCGSPILNLRPAKTPSYRDTANLGFGVTPGPPCPRVGQVATFGVRATPNLLSILSHFHSRGLFLRRGIRNYTPYLRPRAANTSADQWPLHSIPYRWFEHLEAPVRHPHLVLRSLFGACDFFLGLPGCGVHGAPKSRLPSPIRFVVYSLISKAHNLRPYSQAIWKHAHIPTPSSAPTRIILEI